MRILICNWKDLRHPAAGGAEVYTHEVARRWVAAGHQVTIFAAAARDHSAEESIDGVRVVRGGGRFGVYKAAKEFYARDRRWDLVIDEVNTRPFGCVDWVRDTPVVALIHQVCREIWFQEMPLPVALAGRFVLEAQWLRRYRDVPVLTVSQSSRASLEAYGMGRVAVVPEGIGRRPRPPLQREGKPTLIFVGRLTPSKRPYDALTVFARLRRTMPDLRLWLVGDGPLRERLHSIAPPGVSLFGRVTTAQRDELLARAHALVITSVREGWGLVVDEAAAMGTPAVGYDLPGLRDSITAAGGVLTRPRPSSMAAALAERLPGWMADPATKGWEGGALDWDTVATRVLDTAIGLSSMTDVPACTDARRPPPDQATDECGQPALSERGEPS
jgi:glycosyltransferase involved in cell wall biosynthesis